MIAKEGSREEIETRVSAIEREVLEHVADKGRLAVIQAPPGSGKTWLLLKTAAAAFGLGRRVAIAGTTGERCDTPELAAAALAPQFVHLEREQLIVALLNRKQRLLECVTPLYVGSVSGTPVRIAELFAEAIKRQAPAILMAHNHPSGDPTPSADDIRTTREAAHAGRILGIDLVDHLVFGAGRWVSLRRIGALT